MVTVWRTLVFWAGIRGWGRDCSSERPDGRNSVRAVLSVGCRTERDAGGCGRGWV